VVGPSTVGAAVPDRWPGDAIAPRLVGADGAVVLRVLPGLDADATGHLLDRTWTVASASDRMGARLEPVEGSERHPQAAATGLGTTHGVVEGTVQVPPDGQPIVLLADHQPTGGYPVGGVVIRADLPSAGQLRAGDRLTLVRVTGPAAMEALREQRGAWEEAAAIHRADARWNDLWRSAGA
jgi:allophanate hydrolase subunit 2